MEEETMQHLRAMLSVECDQRRLLELVNNELQEENKYLSTALSETAGGESMHAKLEIIKLRNQVNKLTTQCTRELNARQLLSEQLQAQRAIVLEQSQRIAELESELDHIVDGSDSITAGAENDDDDDAGSAASASSNSVSVLRQEMEQLRSQLEEEQAHAQMLEESKETLMGELEGLTQSLFEESNQLVRQANIERYEAEQMKAALLEELEQKKAELDGVAEVMRGLEQRHQLVVGELEHADGGSGVGGSKGDDRRAAARRRRRDSTSSVDTADSVTSLAPPKPPPRVGDSSDNILLKVITADRLRCESALERSLFSVDDRPRDDALADVFFQDVVPCLTFSSGAAAAEEPPAAIPIRAWTPGKERRTGRSAPVGPPRETPLPPPSSTRGARSSLSPSAAAAELGRELHAKFGVGDGTPMREDELARLLSDVDRRTVSVLAAILCGKLVVHRMRSSQQQATLSRGELASPAAGGNSWSSSPPPLTPQSTATGVAAPTPERTERCSFCRRFVALTPYTIECNAERRAACRSCRLRIEAVRQYVRFLGAAQCGDLRVSSGSVGAAATEGGGSDVFKRFVKLRVQLAVARVVGTAVSDSYVRIL